MTCFDVSGLRAGSAALAAAGLIFAAGHAAAQPIADDDPALVAFATEVVDFSPAPGLADSVSDPDAALGAPDSGSTGSPDFTPVGLVSLGDPATGVSAGSITLGFDQAITNGTGADFAVFENAGSFTPGEVFAELAFVEVSTNGTDFARFPTESSTTFPDPAGPALPTDLVLDFSGNQDFATVPLSNTLTGFAGIDPAFSGTPFDLEALVADALVLSGVVDLDEINFVRLVDIPGDGRDVDSLGNPIFDAFSPGNATGGFDLDAVGVINQVPEPGAGLLLAAAGLVAGRRRRGSA
ncbi:MAG: PEP-CTERM sorting domain-containing protein [Planctomycetota bacterium]